MSNIVKRQGSGSVQPYEPKPPSFQLPPNEEVDVRHFWTVLLKRKWRIFVVTLGILIPCALFTFLSTPLFKSTAKLQIDPESAQVLPYKEVGESTVSDFDVYLKTEYEILQSPSLARRVIDRLNLTEHRIFSAPTGIDLGRVKSVLFTNLPFLTNFPFLEVLKFGDEAGASENEPEASASKQVQAEKRFLGMLEVNPIRSSRLVNVSYAAPDPEFAAQVVNVLAEEYVNQHFLKKYEMTEKATRFLNDELGKLKVKVEEAEQELIRYAGQHGILNLDEKQGDVVRQRLSDLNQRMTEIEGEFFAKTAQYNAFKLASVTAFPKSLETESIARLEDHHFELEQKLVSLSSRFGENWPEVIQIKKEIIEVQKQLAEQKKATLAQAVKQASLEFEKAREEYQLLLSAFDEQRSLTNQLNMASVQYNILSREVESNKELYEGLLQRLKETGVAVGLEFGNVRIVDSGRVESAPYRPRKLLNLLLALILGLTLGVGWAFFSEYLDNTVKTPDDLEQVVRVPVLALIPSAQNLAYSGSARQQKKLLRLSAPRLSVLNINSPDLRRQKPSPSNKDEWRVWEAYRSLRTSILLSKSDHPPKKILVTSAVPKEGKTTTVAHLGMVLAQTGARTVMVDLDMRKPQLAARFRQNGHGDGMSVFLSGNSKIVSEVRETEIPNLFVLPAGIRPPNPAELLASQRLKVILKELGGLFQYVLIDSPPVLTVTDARVIAPHVDGVVLVVKAGETPKEVVTTAKTHLHRVGAHILGAVLNDVDFQSAQYSYYENFYYHGAYYGDQST